MGRWRADREPHQLPARKHVKRLCDVLTYKEGRTTAYALGRGSWCSDLTGDGVADLAIGGQNGANYIVAGPVTGDLHLDDAHATLVGDRSDGPLVAPGVLDGDGFDDLALVLECEAIDYGADVVRGVSIAYGPFSGTAYITAAPTLSDETDGQQWHPSMAGVGAISGDGLPKVAVGFGESDLLGFGSGTVSIIGAIASDGSHELSEALIAGEAEQESGYSVGGPGDVDGDGVPDLLASAEPSAERPALHLFYGPLSGAISSLDAAARVSDGGVGYSIGQSIGSLGDADLDGCADTRVTAPTADVGKHRDAGQVFVIDGDEWADLLVLTFAAARIEGRLGDQGVGEAAAALGDIDGDEYADRMIGGGLSHTYSPGGGAAHVALGAISGRYPTESGTTSIIDIPACHVR